MCVYTLYALFIFASCAFSAITLHRNKVTWVLLTGYKTRSHRNTQPLSESRKHRCQWKGAILSLSGGFVTLVCPVHSCDSDDISEIQHSSVARSLTTSNECLREKPHGARRDPRGNSYLGLADANLGFAKSEFGVDAPVAREHAATWGMPSHQLGPIGPSWAEGMTG